jgi:flagellar basal-body rod modification protein FlgD
MSEISGVGLNAVLDDLQVRQTPKESELGRDEFLELLVAQLENQDPLSPQENGEFVAQLAQFSSLEEQQNLSSSFDRFASNFQSSQNLQATSLVGRSVHVASNSTELGSSGSVSVLADLPAGVDSALLTVYSPAGAVIENVDLGQVKAGRNEFVWNGQGRDGTRYPPGQYRFAVTTSQNGIAESAPIFLSSNVNSVTIEPGGSLTLNLAGVGPTPMSQVIQIN